jgi:PhnB protein
MNQEAIAKAGEIIGARANYIGNGMEGYATVTTIDENGFPSSTTMSISKADGINWLTFNSDANSNPVKRIAGNPKACVCLSSSEYHINLVGTFEILDDIESKRENWQEPLTEYYANVDEAIEKGLTPIKFTTFSYNIYIVDGDLEAKGTLKDADKKPAPLIEPMFQFDRQCEQAIELYKKAFGAKVAAFIRYADADPKDRPPKYDNEKDANLVYHAQLIIGNRRILLCDNLFNDLPRGHSVYPVIMVKTADEVKSAYNVLLDGAEIITPMVSTTYSACVVSLVDKFGIFWDLMVG